MIMIHHTDFKFREQLLLREPGDTKYIIIHHSRVKGEHSVHEVHDWHLKRKTKDGKYWAGIGYHFYITKKGEIYEGRPLDAVGSHAYGYNSRSIGVCFEGDFNEEEMTDCQLDASVMLLSLLSLAYGNAEFRRHDTLDCESCCPGTNFPYKKLIGKVRVCKKQIVSLYGEAKSFRYRDMVELFSRIPRD